ncbi:MAG: MFS transporter [Bifidobacterium sp.]|jgi:sugar phosphate permease|nr:MFS transporter [Bifidobacterium sp.]MCI1865007.1 MFS transporter [Bifidobacterium sp.]
MNTETGVNDEHDLNKPNDEATRGKHLRWLFITLLVLGGVVNYLDRSNLSIANTTIAKEFGLDSTQMGLILAAFSWPYAIANLPAGYLVDKFGPKKIYSWAATLWSVVSLLSATASTYGAFYAFRVALGISESPFFTAGLKVCDNWFDDKEKALPVSIVNTGSQIANAIAPPILTILLIKTGWRGMFVIIGGLGLIVTLLWVVCYRNPTVREIAAIKGKQWVMENASSKPSTTKQKDDRNSGSWTDLFKQSNTYFMIIGAFGIFYTVWVYLTWLPTYLQKARGFDLMTSGWLAMLPYLCGIVGVLAGGWVSGNMLKAGYKTITARKVPIVVGAFLAACSVLPVAYVHNITLTMILLCVGYFASQVPIGCMWTLAADVAKPNQVSSLGAIQNFGGFVGAAAAPMVTGYILDRTGQNFTLAFVVAGILLLVGAASYLFFVKSPASNIIGDTK